MWPYHDNIMDVPLVHCGVHCGFEWTILQKGCFQGRHKEASVCRCSLGAHGCASNLTVTCVMKSKDVLLQYNIKESLHDWFRKWERTLPLHVLHSESCALTL